MKILVPVDGSRHSMESLKIATHFAKAKDAGIYIMNVTSSVADIDLEISASERDLLMESMKKRGLDLLQKARQTVQSLGAGKVHTILATAESPAAEIVSLAEKEKVDLVVIGSRGRSSASRFILGSVASKVVRHSPCCVYVVKEPCWA